MTGVAWTLDYQGDVAREQGDPAEARKLYEQGLEIFWGLSDRLGIAGTLVDLGNLEREQGNYPKANAQYRESLKTTMQNRRFRMHKIALGAESKRTEMFVYPNHPRGSTALESAAVKLLGEKTRA